MPEKSSGTPWAPLLEKTGRKVRTEWWNRTRDAAKKRSEVSGEICLGIESGVRSPR
jgi:hypothetical protein